jgi:hypothetical protein
MSHPITIISYAEYEQGKEMMLINDMSVFQYLATLKGVTPAPWDLAGVDGVTGQAHNAMYEKKE